MPEGIISDNMKIQKTESIITPKQLKERYLFGIDLSSPQTGEPLSDEAIQNFINTATSQLEHDLDISIVPRQILEQKDYMSNDYWQWGYFQLNEVPVISVDILNAVYPNANILEYPSEWFKLQNHDGILRLIPTAGKLAQFMVDAGGQYFPEIFRYQGHVPLVWQITYTAGFKDCQIPLIMNQAIGLLAAIQVLNVIGNLVLLPGIVSQSLSLDDMSQVLSTAKGPQSHAFSGLIHEYRNTLFGDPQNPHNPGVVNMLRTIYRGETLNLI